MTSRPSFPPRFQFSLRWLFVAVTVVAVLLGLLAFQIGQGIAYLCFLFAFRTAIPAAALAGAIYGRGDLQAFAIGALVPCIPVLTSGDAAWDRWGLVFGTVLHLITVGLSGGVAMVTRRLVGRVKLPGIK